MPVVGRETEPPPGLGRRQAGAGHESIALGHDPGAGEGACPGFPQEGFCRPALGRGKLVAVLLIKIEQYP